MNSTSGWICPIEAADVRYLRTGAGYRHDTNVETASFGRTAWQLFGPSQGHHLHTTQTQKTRRHIPAQCGFRTHDSIVWPSEDGALLRLRAHRDQQSWFKMHNVNRINHDASNDYSRHYALCMTVHLDFTLENWGFSLWGIVTLTSSET